MENQSPQDGSPVTQVRIARPTDRLAEVVRFYSDALGLEQIASFEGHAGYDGVMLALPGGRDHLEFTHYQSGSPCPARRRTTSSYSTSMTKGPSVRWLHACGVTDTNRSSPRTRTGQRRG